MQELNLYPTLTDDEILKLGRSNIRYALHSYSRGNITGDNAPIINYYIPRITQYGLLREEYTIDWDISTTDPRDIVSGHIVRKYNEVLNSSLFNEDGSLKDSPIAKTSAKTSSKAKA